MSVGFFGVADRQILLPLRLVMSCAKSCPSDFSGSQGGCLCESPEVPPDSIARMRALQRAKTHDPRKKRKDEPFWAEQKEQIDSISEFKESRECKENRSILGVCEHLTGEQQRNAHSQNLFVVLWRKFSADTRRKTAVYPS